MQIMRASSDLTEDSLSTQGSAGPENSSLSSAVESMTTLGMYDDLERANSEVKIDDLWDIFQTSPGVGEIARAEQADELSVKVGEAIAREVSSASVKPFREDSLASLSLQFRELVLGAEDFFDPTTAALRSSLCTRFLAAYEMFLKSVHACSLTVISELFSQQQTFEPVPRRPEDPMYGVSRKFSVNGLTFHLTLPGPTDQVQASRKLMGVHFRNVRHLHQLEVSAVRTPVMACVDFVGFRVMVSLQDEDPPTSQVRYGLDSEGHLHKSSVFINHQMKDLGRRMGFLPDRFAHADWPAESAVLWTSPDLTASPDQEQSGRMCVRAEHAYPWWRSENGDTVVVQLRPELLSRVPTSMLVCTADLSSGTKLQQLVSYLRQTLIPEVAAELDQQVELDPASLQRLDVPFQLHRRGINLRFLGWVRTACKSKPIRNALLCEMLLRTCKALIHDDLHAQLGKSGSLAVPTMKKWMVMWLNRIFGSTSGRYWDVTVRERLQQRYLSALSLEEQECSFFGLAQRNDLLVPLFEKLACALGCKMSTRLRAAPLTGMFFDEETPLAPDDVVDLVPNVKHFRMDSLARTHHKLCAGILNESLKMSGWKEAYQEIKWCISSAGSGLGVQMHRVAGLLQEKLGNVLQARAHLQASLSHASRNPFALSNLVRFLARQEEALDYEGVVIPSSQVFDLFVRVLHEQPLHQQTLHAFVGFLKRWDAEPSLISQLARLANATLSWRSATATGGQLSDGWWRDCCLRGAEAFSTAGALSPLLAQLSVAWEAQADSRNALTVAARQERSALRTAHEQYNRSFKQLFDSCTLASSTLERAFGLIPILDNFVENKSPLVEELFGPLEGVCIQLSMLLESFQQEWKKRPHLSGLGSLLLEEMESWDVAYSRFFDALPHIHRQLLTYESDDQHALHRWALSELVTKGQTFTIRQAMLCPVNFLASLALPLGDLVRVALDFPSEFQSELKSLQHAYGVSIRLYRYMQHLSHSTHPFLFDPEKYSQLNEALDPIVFQWHTDHTGKLRECDANFRQSLMTRDRELLRSGSLMVASELSQVFLFNDLLLVAEAEESKSKTTLAKTLLLGKRRAAPAPTHAAGFSYRYSLSLVNCDLDVKDSKSILLKTSERNLLVVFKSSNACKVWLEDLQRAVRRSRERLCGLSLQALQLVHRQPSTDVPLLLAQLLDRLSDLTPVNAKHLFTRASPLSAETTHCVDQLARTLSKGPGALLDLTTALQPLQAASVLLRLLLELENSLIGESILDESSDSDDSDSDDSNDGDDTQKTVRVQTEQRGIAAAQRVLSSWLRCSASAPHLALLEALQRRVHEIASLSSLIPGVSLEQIGRDLGPFLVEVHSIDAALAVRRCQRFARALFLHGEISTLLKSPRSTVVTPAAAASAESTSSSATLAAAAAVAAAARASRGSTTTTVRPKRPSSNLQTRKPLPPPPPSAPKPLKKLGNTKASK
mmetsp:Transcript_8586/g.26634  ORF Transcript_8586/g.26634 Transcript_8586/m.26634 type:complete len:1460 (-) Transcript_8586:203-4582(-)